MNLNPEQRTAVEHPHDALLTVIAGAGTGKTQLLTARFLRLTQEARLAPEHILCLTFTRKAAYNMRRRILEEMRKAGRPIIRPERLWISTFDGIAWRILADNLLSAHLPPDMRLLTPGERDAIRDHVWNALCSSPTGVSNGVTGRLWKTPSAIRKAVFETHDRLKVSGTPTQRIPMLLGPQRDEAYRRFEDMLQAHLASKERKGRKAAQTALALLSEHEQAEAGTARLLQAVGDAYERAFADGRVLDFAGVLLRATELCEQDSRWRDRFKAVLVDECQDTSGAKFRLLEALAAPELRNVTIVGDLKQSIYSFQGARPENTAALTVDAIKLTRNYRSVGEILDAAHDAIRETMPEEPELTAELRGYAGTPRVWFTRLADEATEGAWIAREIRALEGAGTSYAPIMILVRTRTRFTAIADALTRAAIPYDVMDKHAGWQREVLKTAVALLRVAVDPLDDVALVRLLQEAPVGLSDGALFQLLGTRGGRSVFEVLRAAETVALRERANTIAELTARAHTMPGAEFVSYAIRRWGLLDVTLRGDDARRADFRALAQLYAAAARMFSAVPAPTMAQFVQDVRDGRVELRDELAIDATAPRNAVRLCNIHQVKGLEFPIVFVAGLGYGRFPSGKTTDDLFCYDDQLGFCQRKTWDQEDMGRWMLDVQDRWRARNLDEEQRLLYVAMTRAQHRLYLTTSTRPPKAEKLGEPQYFVEQLEDRARTGQNGIHTLTADTHAPPPGADELAAIRDEVTPVPVAGPDVNGDLAAHAHMAAGRIRWTGGSAHEPVTVTVSFTSVAAYLQCPRLYAYRYYHQVPAFDGAIHDTDEMPTRAPRGLSPATLGTVVHRALELFHATSGAGAGDMVAALDGALHAVDAPQDAYRASAEDMLQRYATWNVAHADIVEREAPFVLHLPAANGAPAVRVRGAIDRIDRTADGYVIWDYKTGAATSAQLREKYATQLQVYTHAAEQALGRTPVQRAGVIALHVPDESDAVGGDVDVSADAIEAALTQVHLAATRIGKQDFAVVTDAHADRPCRYCDYRGWCPDVRSDGG